MTKMPTRRFGRTELAMPVLTCGGMRYQHSWSDVAQDKIPEANQMNLEACIHRAIELGINHIETARGYGSSEMQLGRILPEFPREKLIVQTKVAPNCTGEEFLKTFEQSMSYLGLEHVELLSLHGINNAELLNDALKPNGPLAVARQLQRQGRVQFIGFSTHGDCDTITAAINTGEFDYVNLHWYWINQVNWPAIEAATRHDMGVFIISPNDKGGKLYEPSEKLSQQCAPLSPMVFNDLFCLRRAEVHTLSIGVSRPEDFDEHIRAVSRLPEVEPLVAAVEKRLHESLILEHGDQWCSHWQEGIPRWEDIPGNINVWEIARLWTYAKALDMVEFGKMRYNLLGNADHWFPGLNAEKFDEPALLTSLSQSPFRDRFPEILREAHGLLFDKPVERLSKSED